MNEQGQYATSGMTAVCKYCICCARHIQKHSCTC